MDTNGLALNAVPGVQQVEPEYNSLEEAEGAFMKMLKRHNVQPDWSWEQTIRATIKDPQYRSLKDPRDRKAAFEKYAVEVRMQEKDRAKERFAKLRADFNTMLKRHPEIKHYSRWKTIRPIIEGETIFRSTDDEDERRQLFEEYILELKKEHMEEEAAKRKAAMDELATILKSLDLEPYTRWSEAQAIIQSNDKVQNDEKFKSLSKSDILTAFENHIKSLERAFNDARQQQKAAKARKERHAREQFIDLLKELRSQGKIKAGSKWMNIYPMINTDPRYLGILGNSGSSPMELFWDVVEEEERSLRGPRNDVLDVLDVRLFPTFSCEGSFLISHNRTNDSRSLPRPLLKSSTLSCLVTAARPISTRKFFSFCSSVSRRRLCDETKRRSMRLIATSAVRLMLCDLASSVWNPLFGPPTAGIRYVPEWRN
jgi:pre-mRNA-processing factor 40